LIGLLLNNLNNNSMKKIGFTLSLIFLMFANGFSQNSINPWGLSFNYSAMDFAPSREAANWFKPKNWNTGVQIQGVRAINSSFNIAPSVHLGTLEKSGFNSTSSLALDLAAQYRFANGYIIKNENYWFDPYLTAGGGVHFIDGKGKSQMGAGAGINFWLQENVGINIQTVFNWLPRFDNYVHHTIGLRFRWGAKDSDDDGISDRDDACPNEKGLANLKGCPDSDLDGIADKDDACPNAIGSAEMKGCPDSDGDGVVDKDDACPSDKGLATLSGCPDSDGDGVADKNDTCPTVKGLTSMNGCPDSDADGIADKDDACPNEKGVSAFGGCPDSDGDGIADKDDKCPTVAGIASMQGCPEKKVTVEEKAKVEQQLKMIAKKVQFETGRAVITKASLAELDKVLAFMNEYPGSKFAVEGHTDNVGVAANNLKLSQSRADAVKKYFTDKGISSDRINAVGYGQTKPIDNNATPAGRTNNRRVEIHLAD
jgi:OmpA-OmpF porin, OOP family